MKISLPKLRLTTVRINNGVKIFHDVVFPSSLISLMKNSLHLIGSVSRRYINGNFEAGLYLSHLRVTRPNDKVLAVGLGYGASLIPVVKMMSSKGFYRSIEASNTQISIAKKNILLNNINEQNYEIIHGFAGGKIFNSYGESNHLNIDINDYDFDVLELDCEGSELSIIRSMDVRPRNIIVELHPKYFDNDFKNFGSIINLLASKGYEYQFAYGHNGDYLTEEYANYYFNLDSRVDDSNVAKFKIETHYFWIGTIVVTFLRI